MDKIKIITDSTADLSIDILEERKIESLPLLINFGEESYLDGVEINTATLFQRVKEGSVFPTTAQVTPQRFYDCYKKYLDEGYKILSIHLSSKMSGTYQSACIAKEMLESDNIYVIDSQNVTSGLGLLVLKASKLLEDGVEIEKIVDEIEKKKLMIRSSLAFESLEHLVKGGRLSKTAGVIGSVLGIRLILEVNNGEMVVKEKVRGTKKAIKKIIEDLVSNEIDTEEPLLLLNSLGDEIYNKLKEYLDENKIEYVKAEVGCTVGIHAGPGAAGVFFIPKNK